jgi:hypothetical protein
VNTGECGAFRSARAQLPAIIGETSPLKPIISLLKYVISEELTIKKCAPGTDHQKEHSCHGLGEAADLVR